MKKYKINPHQVEIATFFSGDYYEYDETEEKFKEPINISYKQNDDSTQGVGSGGNRQSMTQGSQGRRQYVYDYIIKVYDDRKYKGGDKIKLHDTGISYIVQEVLKNDKHPNSILNIAFSRIQSNRSRSLVMKVLG